MTRFEEVIEADINRVYAHIKKAGAPEDYDLQRLVEHVIKNGLIAYIKYRMRKLHPEEIPRLACSENHLIASFAHKLLARPEWHLIQPEEEYE